MLPGSLPAVALACGRRDRAGVLAYLAALVLLFQLPGPATCLKLAQHFTAVPLEAIESDEPQAEEAAAEPEVVSVRREHAPLAAGRSLGREADVPLRRQLALVDAGPTRAPPAAV